MSVKLSRRGNVAPFMAMDVFAKAKALEANGRSIIHFSVGQPSTGLPRLAAEKLISVMNDDPLGYSEATGNEAVRQAVAAHYQNHYGVDVEPNRVFMTMGSSGAFQLAFLAAFDEGDRIALALPAYPPYVQIIRALGLVPQTFQVGPAERYQPTVEQIQALSPRPDGLLLASPANPTGTSLENERYRALLAYCAEVGIRVICDEIYHGLEYGAGCETACDAPGEPIIINGFSKFFCMTGWRLGWMVLPENLVQTVERLGQSLFIAPPTPSQVAAVEAFNCQTELNANVDRYRRNRQVLLDGLGAIGLEPAAPPDGAFYLYLDVSEICSDSSLLCDHLVEDIGVSLTPGRDFDPDRGHKFIRLSYAGSEADVSEGLGRLTRWVETNKAV